MTLTLILLLSSRIFLTHFHPHLPCRPDLAVEGSGRLCISSAILPLPTPLPKCMCAYVIMRFSCSFVFLSVFTSVSSEWVTPWSGRRAAVESIPPSTVVERWRSATVCLSVVISGAARREMLRVDERRRTWFSVSESLNCGTYRALSAGISADRSGHGTELLAALVCARRHRVEGVQETIATCWVNDITGKVAVIYRIMRWKLILREIEIEFINQENTSVTDCTIIHCNGVLPVGVIAHQCCPSIKWRLRLIIDATYFGFQTPICCDNFYYKWTNLRNC